LTEAGAGVNLAPIMKTLVCGRSTFARISVCPKAKRKSWFAIAAIYLAAAIFAAAAITASRNANATTTPTSASTSGASAKP
jgi:hypothetical protein